MTVAKKTLAVLLAAVVLLCTLASCASDRKNAACYIDKSGSVSVNLLYLIAADQKQLYKNVVDTYGDGDWNSIAVEENGTTFADLIENVTLQSARNSLICEYLHDTVYGLALSPENEKAVDDRIAALVKAYGSERALNEALSAYSADITTLRRYQTLAVKQSALYQYLYGEHGTEDVEDDVRAYFEDNYAIVTHIYFNIGVKYKEDGSAVSLTDEEIAEKRALATELYNRILAGDDYAVLKAQYSEDVYESVYYPNGFFVTGDTTFPTAFTTAALDMRVGEFRLVESDSAQGGGIHILYRLPMNADLYNSDETVYTNIRNIVVAEKAQTLMESYADLVTENPDVLKKLNVAVVPPLALAQTAS